MTYINLSVLLKPILFSHGVVFLFKAFADIGKRFKNMFKKTHKTWEFLCWRIVQNFVCTFCIFKKLQLENHISFEKKNLILFVFLIAKIPNKWRSSFLQNMFF